MCYGLYKYAMGFIESEAQVIPGYGNGDWVAKGCHLLYLYYFSRHAAHFHQLDEDIVFFKRMDTSYLSYHQFRESFQFRSFHI